MLTKPIAPADEPPPVFAAQLITESYERQIKFDRRRLRTAYSIMADNSVFIDLDEGNWAYLFEHANSQRPKDKVGMPTFYLPQEGSAYLLTASAAKSSARIWVALAYHDPNQSVVEFQTHPLSSANRGISISSPAKAIGVALGLRVSGKGILSNIVFRLTNRANGRSYSLLETRRLFRGRITNVASLLLSEDAKYKSERELSVSQQHDDFQRATRLLERKRYFEVISVLAATPTTQDLFSVLLRTLSALRDYEGVANLADKYPHYLTKAIIFRRLLEAFVALGRYEQAEEIFRAYLRKRTSDFRAQSFLSLTFKYAQKIGGSISEAVGSFITDSPLSLPLGWREGAEIGSFFVASGRRSAYEAILRRMMLDTSPQAAVAVEFLMAQFHFSNGNYEAQCNHINNALRIQGIDPVRLLNADEPFSCSNVASTLSHRILDGPLVSIIMTTFDSKETIHYALRSLQEQTYQNLQIIVVDDCSRDGTLEVVRAIAQNDLRVQVLCLESNSGTYVAKNHGLAIARGKYFLCQDSDDWAHPSKVACLVGFMERSDVVAAQVSYVRVGPTVGLSARAGFIRPDASSLTCRREAVLTRLGYFESVRAGADSEYALRVERAFDAQVKRISSVYSFVALSESSLSGGGRFSIDEITGIFADERIKYRRQFLERHEAEGARYVDVQRVPVRTISSKRSAVASDR